jgi:hypothetical protein
MRTKTLLIAAAALAAGVISSQAQPVYSANIVGYVNLQAGTGFSQQPTPLDLAPGNSLTNIFQNPSPGGPGNGAIDGDQVYIWNSHGFTILTFDSTLSTGLGDARDTDGIAQPVPTVNPGELIFFFNGGNKLTNTIVGQVHNDVAPTGSQVVGTTTNILPVGLDFVASKLPIAGGVSSVLGITNSSPGGPGNGVLDGDQIYVPLINAQGAFQGYNIVTFDSTLSTGFGDARDTDGIAQPEPIIPVGGGFIFGNYGSSTIWTQSL